MKNSIFWLIPLTIALVLSGCKKDEETTSTPSLSGLSISTVVPYISPGTTITLKANTGSIIASDGSTPDAIGIAWQVNSAKKDTLTRNVKESNPDFVYKADTLGTYSFNCYAFAGSGYYSASSTATVKAILPEKSLTGLAGTPSTQIGGHNYRTIEAGGLTWMAENLYGTESGSYYMDSQVTESIFGKFYTWEEAKAACPSGWHLPSAQEWDSMGTDAGVLMANASFLEEDMWTYWPQVVITNSLQFNVIPVGYQDRTVSGTVHYGFNEYALFWTADQAPDPSDKNAQLAQYRFIFGEIPTVQKGNGSAQSLAISVRCVKD